MKLSPSHIACLRILKARMSLEELRHLNSLMARLNRYKILIELGYKLTGQEMQEREALRYQCISAGLDPREIEG